MPDKHCSQITSHNPHTWFWRPARNEPLDNFQCDGSVITAKKRKAKPETGTLQSGFSSKP